MKHFLLLAFFAYGCAERKTEKRIVFFGDSLTEEGVRAHGYVTQLKEMLQVKNKSVRYTLIGAGVSGDKISDLYLRLENDVLAKKPDAAVVWVGINDVYLKTVRGTGTEDWKFSRFYEALVKKLKQNNIKVYLCTPTVVGERVDTADAVEKELDEYALRISNLARQHDCTLIDLRKTFFDYLAQYNKDNRNAGILTYDGIHLNEKGNRLVAEKMFEALR